jgi:N-acetyl-anhydromuramyl-L-alanine amidase AmpD
VVRRDGSIELGRPLEKPGAHCVGHNRYSIGICYEGGLNAAGEEADTRTPEQRATLRKLVKQLHQRFPKAVIVGHRDLNPGKKCPCYDAVGEYRDLQPP